MTLRTRRSPARSRTSRLYAALLIGAVGAPLLAQQDASWTDPAPPDVAELPDVAPPQPRDYDGWRPGTAPKPLAADAVTEDWPGFLGPRRDGRSRETRLHKSWGEAGPPLVWSMERGEGYASPAVVGDRVVYPHRVGNKMLVDCLEADTGRRLWRYRDPTDYRGDYIRDSGPRATPMIDDGLVYVHGVEGRLHCLELATGRRVWRRDLAAEFELADEFFGVVSSPLVFGDLLIVNLGVRGGPSVIALDKKRGRIVWGGGDKWGASCASPVVAKVHGEPWLFVLGGGKSRPPTGGLMALDPKTGAVHFEYPFRSRTYESVIGSSPLLVGEERLLVTASYNTGTAMLGLNADKSFAEQWKSRRFGLEFATPLFVDGHLYAIQGVRERAGAVVCLDPADGNELARTDIDWEETVTFRGEPRTQGFSVGNGCLVWADGAFLCLGDYGHLLWLECTPKGAKVLARTALFHATESWTPPVISRGLLYVCQNQRERFGDAPRRLLCYDLRAAGE
ncbi:MAG: PQQ-binding-like beta-propeller repeat protein [Planctomycetota bacterium]